jgi:hypothetical protein
MLKMPSTLEPKTFWNSMATPEITPGTDLANRSRLAELFKEKVEEKEYIPVSPEYEI